MQDFRGIGQGGQDILSSQLRIFRHNLLNRQAIRQAPDDHPHWDAGARDAGLSVMNLGISNDPLLAKGCVSWLQYTSTAGLFHVAI